MEDVFEAIVKASQAYTLPSPWQNIPCDPAFIRLPTDGASLLAELRRQFSDELLINAGAETVDAEGNVGLSENLVADDAPVWAIRSNPDQKVTALVTQMKSLGNDEWALATAMRDHRQYDLIADAEEQIVVAYSMQDLAILRSLGIAAVPGGNWDQLSKPQLDFLCEILRIAPRAPVSSTLGPEELKPQVTRARYLTVANWSLATMDSADVVAVTTSWAHLVEIYSYLDLSFGTLGLWKPSEKNLKQLRFQAQYMDVQNLCARLLEGMEEDSSAIDADLYAKPHPPQSVVDAHRAWQVADRDKEIPVGRLAARRKTVP